VTKPFITPRQEAFEDEFCDAERLDYERSHAITFEFEKAIRKAIGTTWMTLTWHSEEDRPLPFHEIECALSGLIDELHHWRGTVSPTDTKIEAIEAGRKLRAV
jgi:hypothetical protein